MLKYRRLNSFAYTFIFFRQYWYDYKLQWDPDEYGGVDMLHVPSDHIWRPDIVLYNKYSSPFLFPYFLQGLSQKLTFIFFSVFDMSTLKGFKFSHRLIE